MYRYRRSRQSEKEPDRVDGHISRKLCIVGLAFCWLVGLAALAIGVYLVAKGGIPVSNESILGYPFIIPGGIPTSLNKYAKEIVPLGLNILVTICNDITGYIHTVSLRWALQRESRLILNSNLRLFTSARKCRANRWYTNFMMAVFMIISYTSTSLLLIRQTTMTNAVISTAETPLLPPNKDTFICGYAAIILAIAMLGQAVVASICIPTLAKVPTWSSDPLEVTSACIRLGNLHRRRGRCMRSVHDLKKPAEPVSPSHRQKSFLSAIKKIRVLLRLWITPIYTVVWGIVVKVAIGGNTITGDDGLVPGKNWSFFPNSDLITGDFANQTPSVYIAWISNEAQIFDLGSFLFAVFVIGVIQAFLTGCLHFAELLVNTIRDERSWRKASQEGHKSSNALSSMLGSFPALVLFALKPLLHWLYGLAVSVYFTEGIVMRLPQIFYLAGGATLLAVFATSCLTWRPKGPQPATFGHLQTLADLVDMWPGDGEKMFWGEKDLLDATQRQDSSVWHAGTAAEPLEPVRFDKQYMGFVRCEGKRKGREEMRREELGWDVRDGMGKLWV